MTPAQFRQCRLMLGMTLKEYGDALGMNFNTVSRIERAMKWYPVPEGSVKKIAKLLKKHGINCLKKGENIELTLPK